MSRKRREMVDVRIVFDGDKYTIVDRDGTKLDEFHYEDEAFTRCDHMGYEHDSHIHYDVESAWEE